MPSAPGFSVCVSNDVSVAKFAEILFTRSSPPQGAVQIFYSARPAIHDCLLRLGEGVFAALIRAKGAAQLRMQPERRAHQRIKMETPCWLGTDTHKTLLECELRDMSAGGAQIKMPFPAPLPEQVQLYLTADRAVVRKSKVIWSDGPVVGLMFLKDTRAVR